MTDHEADADLKVLFLCFLIQGKHLSCGRAIRGERFFHEDVDAFLDGILVVDPAEDAGGGEDGNVARTKGVNGLFVGIEPNELSLGRNIHLVGDIGAALQGFPLGFEVPFKDIGHGVEADRALFGGGLEGIDHRSGTSSSAADETESNRGIVVGGKHMRNGNSGES